MTDRDTFAAAYVEAAAFAGWPEDAPGGASWAPETLATLLSDAGAFYDAHAAAIAAYPEGLTQAGHDLWYTRCGDGCGYWEHEGNAAADELDAAASALGTVDLYLGDDGQVWA